MTFPCRRREIPSPKSGESLESSSIGIFCRIKNSEPNFFISRSYSNTTDLLDAPTCIISESISGSGTRLNTFPAVAGLNVLLQSRSASSQTRLSTPIVIGLPQTGQIPLNFFVSSGVIHTLHFLCPSS